MPTGEMKWFSVDKGFGFVASDEGGELFVHITALPPGETVTEGTRIEFDITEGRRGPQAGNVTILEHAPAHAGGRSQAPARAAVERKDPEELCSMVEDLIHLLDDVSNSLRAGRYPERSSARNVTTALRSVADNLEA